MDDIKTAEWKSDGYSLVLRVKDKEGRDVKCYLTKRRHDCDRGHLMLQVDGHFHIDKQDSFPRYFFSFERADRHTRAFLKWRIYQVSDFAGMSLFDILMEKGEE